MKLSSVIIGGLAAWLVSASGDNIPQAVGIDVESLIGQYLPLILGVVVAFVNESDNIPAWIKKIVSEVGKSKGADIGAGNKALEAYLKLLEFLEELKKDPEANKSEIANTRAALLQVHERVVVGCGLNED